MTFVLASVVLEVTTTKNEGWVQGVGWAGGGWVGGCLPARAGSECAVSALCAAGARFPRQH